MSGDRSLSSPRSRHIKQIERNNSPANLVQPDRLKADEQCLSNGNVPFYPEGFYDTLSSALAETRYSAVDFCPCSDDRQTSRVALVETGAQWTVGHPDSFPVFTAHLPAFPVDLSLPSPQLPVMPSAYYPPAAQVDFSRAIHPGQCGASDTRRQPRQQTTDGHATEAKECLYPRRPAPRLPGPKRLLVPSPPFSGYGYARGPCKVLLPLGVMSTGSLALHDSEKGQLYLKKATISERSPAGKQCLFAIFLNCF
ncbi:hypothetical protein LSAT2_029174 [Lamellibrachia satsuma]|nr:hypothetical protein LSAT2_029174 [Lamellibrachia satsuma]